MAKRKTNGNEESSPQKKLKITTSEDSSILTKSSNWTQSNSLLIYNDPNAKASSKILALDLDGTIVIPASGRVFPKDLNDWKLLSPNIPDVLKRYVDDGYAIVIMSNQGGLEKMQGKRIADFKTKLEAIFAKIAVPTRAYFALSLDFNRKPQTGMWRALEADNGGLDIDRKASVFCGDAAGRVAKAKIRQDHSHCDRLFAENLGVPFKTPEELWGNGEGKEVRSTYPLLFDPKKFRTSCSSFASLSSPVPPPLQEPPCEKNPILVLMVGYPASGKSFFCKKHLRQRGYEIVSRDVLKDMKKCVTRCEQLLKSGSSVAVDNTNVNPTARSPFLNVARSLGLRAYACVMQTSLDHSRHNELFRQLTSENQNKVNSIVFNQMKANYMSPTKDEGFDDIFDIPFIPDFPSESLQDQYFQYLLEK